MDNELFWKLLEPVHAAAAAFCLRLTGDRDEAMDLYQDALTAALQGFARLRDHDRFRPWLFQTLVNRFKNRRRAAWFRRRRTLTPELADCLPGDDPRGVYANRRLLSRLLDQIGPEDRALVVLHEIEGWSTAELAEMIGRPEGTVKSRLYRARRTMRRRMETQRAASPKRSLKTEVNYAMRGNQTTD